MHTLLLQNWLDWQRVLPKRGRHIWSAWKRMMENLSTQTKNWPSKKSMSWKSICETNKKIKTISWRNKKRRKNSKTRTAHSLLEWCKINLTQRCSQDSTNLWVQEPPASSLLWTCCQMISNRIKLTPRGRRHFNINGSNNNSSRRSNRKNVSSHLNQLLILRVTGLDQLCREGLRTFMRESSKCKNSKESQKKSLSKVVILYQKATAISSQEWKRTSKKKRKSKIEWRRLLSVKDTTRRSLTR